MSKPAVVLAISSVALLSGCTQPVPRAALAAAGAPQRQCFNAGLVNSFNAIDDHTVDVRVGVRQYYRLQLTGACPDTRWTQRVALRTIGGSSWVCRGLDAELIIPTPGLGPQRCLVTDMRPLTDAEARALRYYK